MKVPANVTLEAITPFQTVEFVQTAADGSIAADCSSGSCKCSNDYIDYGNGCEPRTVEQVETTQAPTLQTQQPQTSATEPQTSATEPQTSAMEPQTLATEPQTSATEPRTSATEPQTSAMEPQTLATEPQTSQTATETLALEDPRMSLWVVIGKVNQIFEDTLPDKPRAKLLEKWQKIGVKFQNRFLKLAYDKNCNFGKSFPTDNMAWDGPPCWVRPHFFFENLNYS